MRLAAALILLACAGAALAAEPAKKKAPAAPAAPAGTPSRALAELPALPKAATKDLDCSAQEKAEQRLQQQLQKDSETMQAAYAQQTTLQSVSDEQARALQSLNDPEYYNCLQDLQMRPSELWIGPLREKLDAALTQVDAAKAKADADWCAKQTSEACFGDPAGVRKFNGQAAAAGTQFLKDAQPVYAEYLKDIGDCVTRRDKIVATARGAGVGGAMEAMLIGATQANWGLVSVAAGAQSAVCTVARDAARKYLE